MSNSKKKATTKKATKSKKTLHNTTASKAKENVKDIVFWGNGDTFRLISKASSKKENWMKSTKAMQIDGIGCVVQATTQQGNNVAEALTFVPSVMIEETKNDKGEVTSRKLVAIKNNFTDLLSDLMKDQILKGMKGKSKAKK